MEACSERNSHLSRVRNPCGHGFLKTHEESGFRKIGWCFREAAARGSTPQKVMAQTLTFSRSNHPAKSTSTSNHTKRCARELPFLSVNCSEYQRKVPSRRHQNASRHSIRWWSPLVVLFVGPEPKPSHSEQKQKRNGDIFDNLLYRKSPPTSVSSRWRWQGPNVLKVWLLSCPMSPTRRYNHYLCSLE